jgi:hypothetical protein
MRSVTDGQKRRKMAKIINVTNHILTPAQKADAEKKFGVREFVELPEELKKLWVNIPTDAENLRSFVEPIVAFIKQHKNNKKKTIVLLQGDIGAVFAVVYKSNIADNFRFVQSTTERVSVEKDGVKTSVFNHKMFRTFSYGLSY